LFHDISEQGSPFLPLKAPQASHNKSAFADDAKTEFTENQSATICEYLKNVFNFA